MESVNNNKHRVGWESPSNIAIVKYWGKHGRQLPNNPSISFTLSTAATRTFISYEENDDPSKINIDFTFEGKENKAFSQRIHAFIGSVTDEFFPFLPNIKLSIDSSNSFPHSSGIASSASGMSALALCLCDIEQAYTGKIAEKDAFYKKASIVSRLGSGSACRSLFPQMGLWGYHPNVSGSSDDFAIPVGDGVHPIFHTFHDDILIISAKEKSVSSSAGHGLMVGNPYASARYTQANDRLIILMKALREGDLNTFGKITEDEALTLHALMMCSDPSYILMEEGSLSVMKKIKLFRVETGIPVYFTLDAGPNVHMLYPHAYETQVREFILNDLIGYCHDGRIIHDKVGSGPIKID